MLGLWLWLGLLLGLGLEFGFRLELGLGLGLHTRYPIVARRAWHSAFRLSASREKRDLSCKG